VTPLWEKQLPGAMLFGTDAVSAKVAPSILGRDAAGEVVD